MTGLTEQMEAQQTMRTPATTNENGALGARSARLYYLYARAVDDGDLGMLEAIALPDIKVTRGHHPTTVGVESFLDVYRAHNALKIPVCKHVVTNVVADQIGDEIQTHAYFQAAFLERERTRLVIGYYDDIHQEVEGELRLAHKKIVVERTVELPASSADFSHVGAATGSVR